MCLDVVVLSRNSPLVKRKTAEGRQRFYIYSPNEPIMEVGEMISSPFNTCQGGEVDYQFCGVSNLEEMNKIWEKHISLEK